MLEANFISGYETVTVQGLTQWDKGQKLQITGLATLPATFQVHFANTTTVEAIVMLGSTVAGVGTVDIPNSLLEAGLDVKAWIYVIDAEGSETIKTILFPLTKRTKPADFISEPNPTEQSLLEQTMSGVNAATANMQSQINSTNAQVALKANQTSLDATNAQVAQKADKSEVTNVMTPKGNLAHASLPTTGNTVGWYYYCPDGDGTHGKGNYVWNGTTWYFGGTGDEGYSMLKGDLDKLDYRLSESIAEISNDVKGVDSELKKEQASRQVGDDRMLSVINSETERARSEEARIEALFKEPTEEAVANWLNAHPEATTTVENGSITKEKLAQSTLDFFHNKNDGIKPLHIKTPFEYNEPLHPSVLYFSTGWNGYKFWMVETPLPLKPTLYRDRYECPCIHVSNDGINWSVPNGLVNPIDDLTDEEIANKDYYSDPSFVYRADINRIEVWYRVTRASDKTYSPMTLPTWLVRKTSYDGVHWSEREVINNFNVPSSALYPMVRSMSILYDGSRYQMWFVDGMVNGLAQEPLTIRYSDSTDGKNWTIKRTCKMWNGNHIAWHIDVQYDDGTFHMIGYNRSSENNGIQSVTHYASTDGINWNYVNVIDYARYNFVSTNKAFYKSCAVKVGTLWYAYITVGSDKKMSIALMIGDKLSNMQYYQGTENDDTQVFIKGLTLGYSQKYGAFPLKLDYRSKLQIDVDGTIYTAMQTDKDGNIIFGTYNGKKIILYGGASNQVEFASNMIPSATKTYSIGDVNHRVKDVWVGNSLRLPLVTSNARPTDVTTGSIVYDINLAKPIFFNGSNWIDATGTVV